MDYRFYIYKQSNLVNFDKYDFTQYALLQEITNIAQWNLKVERDREFFTVIRTKFEGQVTVKGADYTLLKSLENTHLQYAVVIHQKCNGTWGEKWKGFFSYFDYKVDEDRCNLNFDPTVWDAYTPIFDMMDIERNILVADIDHMVPMDRYDWPFEVYTNSYTSNAVPIPTWSELFAGSGFYAFSRNGIFLYYDEFGSQFYEVTDVYRRDYGLTDSAIDPPTPNPGGNWTYLEEVSPGVHKWIRPFLNSLYQTYATVVSGGDIFHELQTSLTGTTVYLFGLKRLKKVLEYYATLFGLSYESSFFNDTPCPMGGASLDWTMIQQISNLRAIGEQATKGLMKQKDLLTWIRDTFNVYWYIDSARDFRLEHLKYFENGLSYTYTHVIELDLTSVTYIGYITNMNKYEYAKPSLVRYEKLEIAYSTFTDWIDASIEYPQLSILGNDTKTYSVGWGTDINSMYDIREDLGKEGWALYNVNLDGAFYKVTNTVGALSGNSIQNGRFSAANLMRDLWTWGRLLPTGKVNGVQTTFNSIQKLKKQVELSFPQCCDEIDYNGLVRTELGDGIIDSGTYVSQTGMLKVNLIYE